MEDLRPVLRCGWLMGPKTYEENISLSRETSPALPTKVDTVDVQTGGGYVRAIVQFFKPSEACLVIRLFWSLRRQ